MESSYQAADARHSCAVPGPQALTEPTSGELCAALCEHVAPRLPKFPDPESDQEVTFKRFLLNNFHCEFERYIGPAIRKERAGEVSKGEMEEQDAAKNDEPGDGSEMPLAMEAIGFRSRMKKKQEDLKVGAPVVPNSQGRSREAPGPAQTWQPP